jgi:hypothetical protein
MVWMISNSKVDEKPRIKQQEQIHDGLNTRQVD